MPYTLAHPAFVLPLRRLGLPPAPLVVGAMVPDAPLWVSLLPRAGVTYPMTHSPVGILTVDVLLGLGLWGLWLVLREPLADALPSSVRARVPRYAPLPSRWTGLGLVVAALVVGAGTHVLLDEFTHAGRWATDHLNWLRAGYVGLPGYKWLQYGAGLGGLCVLTGLLGWSATRRPHTEPPRPPARLTRVLRLCVLVGVLGAIAVSARALASGGLGSAAFVGATRGVLVVVLGLLVGAVIWQLKRSPRLERVGAAE